MKWLLIVFMVNFFLFNHLYADMQSKAGFLEWEQEHISDFDKKYNNYIASLKTLSNAWERYKTKEVARLKKWKSRLTSAQIDEKAEKIDKRGEASFKKYNNLFLGLSTEAQVRVLNMYVLWNENRWRLTESGFSVLLTKLEAGIEDLSDWKIDTKFWKTPLKTAQRLLKKVPELSSVIDDWYLLKVAELQLDANPEDIDAKIVIAKAELATNKAELATEKAKSKELDKKIKEAEDLIKKWKYLLQ